MSESRFFRVSDLLKDSSEVRIGSVTLRRVPRTQSPQSLEEAHDAANILITLRGQTFSADQIKDKTITHDRRLSLRKR